MVRVGMLVLLLLAAGCSAGDDASEDPPKKTEAPEEPRELRVERSFSNAPAQGPRKPSVILVPSAPALSRELGA